MSAEIIDWRAEAVTTLATPWTSPWTGVTHRAGAPVSKATVGRWEANRSLAFVTPSPEALAFHLAFDAARRCRDLQAGIESTAPAREGEPWQIDDSALLPLYDYFEACFAVLTFSFLALESFANREIDEGVADTYSVRRAGQSIMLTSAEIQRQLSTDEKLATVVPALINVKSPKGRGPWTGYRQLKLERDAIVHLKAEDAYPRRDRPRPSIFHRLLTKGVDRHPTNAIRLVEWFYVDRTTPRWLTSMRQRYP